MNQPLVCIIILNWNGLRNTLECIESVKKINYKNYKLIVVDNASQNNEAYVLRESCSEDIDVLLSAKNYGYTGGNNIGISYALEKYNPEYILILNNDIIVDPDFLANMVNVAQSHQKIGIVGAKVYYHCYPSLIQCTAGEINMFFGKLRMIGDRKVDSGQYSFIKKCDWVLGCCMLINRKVINEIGLFDEQYFSYWYEVDFCYRCRMAGFDVIYTPFARVWHKKSIKLKIWECTPNKNARSAIPYYYSSRNNFLFMRKHAKKIEFLTFLLYFFTYNLVFVTGTCLIFHRDMMRFKGFLKGILDGIKLQPKNIYYCEKKYKILRARNK